MQIEEDFEEGIGRKIRKKELIRKVAKACDYHIYEIEDMFEALLGQIRSEIIDGNSLEFEGLFIIEVSDTKRDWMNQNGVIIPAVKRKALKLKVTRTLLDELRRIGKAKANRKEQQAKLAEQLEKQSKKLQRKDRKNLKVKSGIPGV